MRSPVKINYFFRFSVTDRLEKIVRTVKIHKHGQKYKKNDFFDFGKNGHSVKSNLNTNNR
jgi:hypothetical protein